MEQNERIEACWREFLRETGRDPGLRYHSCFAFGGGGELADHLAALVLEGRKTATTSAQPSYEAEGEPEPEPGCLSIVTDGAGNARCVIETTAVAVLPFRDVTWEMCSREGEDDNLESWREGHVRYLTADAEEWGYEFTWDMPVIFEDFRVVYKF